MAAGQREGGSLLSWRLLSLDSSGTRQGPVTSSGRAVWTNQGCGWVFRAKRGLAQASREELGSRFFSFFKNNFILKNFIWGLPRWFSG